MGFREWSFYISSDETRSLLIELRDRFDLSFGGESDSYQYPVSFPFREIDLETEDNLFGFSDIFMIRDDTYGPGEKPGPETCSVQLRLSLREATPNCGYPARIYAYMKAYPEGRAAYVHAGNKKLWGQIRRYMGKVAHHPLYWVFEDVKNVMEFGDKCTDDVVRVVREGGRIIVNSPDQRQSRQTRVSPLIPDWWEGPPIKPTPIKWWTKEGEKRLAELIHGPEKTDDDDG